MITAAFFALMGIAVVAFLVLGIASCRAGVGQYKPPVMRSTKGVWLPPPMSERPSPPPPPPPKKAYVCRICGGRVPE